jgi:hypothetical protein
MVWSSFCRFGDRFGEDIVALAAADPFFFVEWTESKWTLDALSSPTATTAGFDLQLLGTGMKPRDVRFVLQLLSMGDCARFRSLLVLRLGQQESGAGRDERLPSRHGSNSDPIVHHGPKIEKPTLVNVAAVKQ